MLVQIWTAYFTAQKRKDSVTQHMAGGRSPCSWLPTQKLMQGQQRRGNRIFFTAPTLPSSHNHKRHWLDRGRIHGEEVWYLSHLTVCLFSICLSKMLNSQTDRHTFIFLFQVSHYSWVNDSQLCSRKKKKNPSFSEYLLQPHPSPSCYIPGMTEDM